MDPLQGLGVIATRRLTSPTEADQEEEAEATCPLSHGLKITHGHLHHILLEESRSLKELGIRVYHLKG